MKGFVNARLVLAMTTMTTSFVLGACQATATAVPALVPTSGGTGANAAVPSAAVTSQLPAGSVELNGAGATFPLPVYMEWALEYSAVDPSVVINYQGIGSGGGKKAIIDGTVDFAGSDSLLTPDEYTAGKDLQMYPMLAGAVVPVYNIEWAKPVPEGTTLPALVLSRQTLADIYAARITTWNDAAIAADNPDLAGYLPAGSITVVHRSDGSGTTEIFTKALTDFSTDWTAGSSTSVEWPADKAGNGVGGKGNAGVAAAVVNTPNSVGYVELSYAISNQLSYAQLINKAGQVVTADSASVASAMTDFANAFDSHLTATIVDGEGAGSWPIVGYTYIVLHTTSMTDCVKAGKLLDYLVWALTDPSAGQRAAELGYSVLPDAVRTQVLSKYHEVTCQGTPVLAP
jgi:phosphate transport system substrate-binding protein